MSMNTSGVTVGMDFAEISAPAGSSLQFVQRVLDQIHQVADLR
jgi:hypothetical protein